METDQSESHSPTSSLRNKLKSSLRLSSCFSNHHHHHQNGSQDDHEPFKSPGKATLTRTSSWRNKSRAHEIPEFKEKCVNFISRIGRHSHGHGRGYHRRRHSMSADFKYDATSYALNFDEGIDENSSDEYPLRNFSSRLPPSPTREIPCS
ncbi:hypothetical protein HS088_TW04G01537 [Tripterygium wilfordii]|uniref:Uncharacterized protein n=1 Tax=Tripterygium wilfordii TaxID=458696 RepID=A0A7J7DTC3_TRIWF|nr:uncharacterized protein LOC119997030 [Tripterygium wilfordii]KAF5749567.1 hypothetical protein HS088_TW04G01537 [Tripterygium wilfordii]